MKFNNKLYDILKWVCMIALPALGTLYFALAGIWGLPYAEAIVGTISAVTTFIGVLIGISTANYNSNKDIPEIMTAFEDVVQDKEEVYNNESYIELSDGKGEDEDGIHEQ